MNIFSYIHSFDNNKLTEKTSDEGAESNTGSDHRKEYIRNKHLCLGYIQSNQYLKYKK